MKRLINWYRLEFFIFLLKLCTCNGRRYWDSFKNEKSFARHTRTQQFENGFLSCDNSFLQKTLLSNNDQCNYPLPECFTTDGGYLCCNKRMEILMREAYMKLKNEQGCLFCEDNIQILSNMIQRKLESNHGSTKFEVVTGVSDYASKIQFTQNFVCKLKIGNRVMLAFAAPQPLPPQDIELSLAPKCEKKKCGKTNLLPPAPFLQLQYPFSPHAAPFLPPLITQPQIFDNFRPEISSQYTQFPQNPPPPQYIGSQQPTVVYPQKRRVVTWRI